MVRVPAGRTLPLLNHWRVPSSNGCRARPINTLTLALSTGNRRTPSKNLSRDAFNATEGIRDNDDLKEIFETAILEATQSARAAHCPKVHTSEHVPGLDARASAGSSAQGRTAITGFVNAGQSFH
jgi:hypothetical protein